MRHGDTTALDGLTVTLAPGKIYGLIGRNGSGKTSLLSVLAVFALALGAAMLVQVGLALVPPAVAVVALSAGWTGPVDEESPPWIATIGLAPALALALAAVAAGLLIVALLTRTMPIRSK